MERAIAWSNQVKYVYSVRFLGFLDRYSRLYTGF